MRVLYLTDRLSHRGGADQHLAAVVAATAAAGHDVTLAFGRAEAELKAPAGVTAVRVRGLTTAVPAGRLGPLATLLDASDVVHAQNVMNPAALELAAAIRRLVVTVQDHRVFCPGPGRTLPDGRRCRSAMSQDACRACLPDPAYRTRLLELTRRRHEAIRGARLVVLSRYMAQELVAAGMPGAEVLPPWIEPGPERGAAGTGFLLGGRLVRHKAPVAAWEAWSLAGRPLPLRVAGVGPLRRALPGSELLGWLDRPALTNALRHARALLFPARWQEPFGILAVEALAQGTPVVAAAAGGTDEWSGAGCVEVPQGDTPAMADAIRRLAADPELARSLGREGQAMVRERFSRERLLPRLLGLYDSVAAGKRPLARPAL